MNTCMNPLACGRLWSFRCGGGTRGLPVLLIHVSSKVEQQTAVKELEKVQRLACLTITSGINSTPTAGMETMLNQPPLNLWVKMEAAAGAYRLRAANVWKHTGYPGSHTNISKMVEMGPAGVMLGDSTKYSPSLNKSFEVKIEGKEQWEDKYRHKSGDIIWFTYGSKMTEGTGAGILGVQPRLRSREMVFSGGLGHVFQAEVYAIRSCVEENQSRCYRNCNIYIYSDSQAALKALNACEILSSEKYK